MNPETQTTHTISGSSLLPPGINAWKIYLDDQGRSIHTVKAFIGDVNLLASYLPPERTLGSITTRDLNDFLDWLKNGRGISCSPKTFSRRITSIKSFFRWLQEKGVIVADPAEKVVQKSVLSPLPKILSPEEYSDVLRAAAGLRSGDKPDARPYTLLRLLLDTGIKKGECLALETNHVDLQSPGGAILFVRYASPEHRYKERKINLSDEWVEAYQEYAAQYDLSEALFPWSQRRLEYLLEDIGKRAGLDKQLSFLMCRWTCAVSDFVSGVDPKKIRQKLGVSNIQWREVLMKIRKLAGLDTDDGMADEIA